MIVNLFLILFLTISALSFQEMETSNGSNATEERSNVKMRGTSTCTAAEHNDKGISNGSVCFGQSWCESFLEKFKIAIYVHMLFATVVNLVFHAFYNFCIKWDIFILSHSEVGSSAEEKENYRRRSSSMMEVKEHAHQRLRDELQRAKEVDSLREASRIKCSPKCRNIDYWFLFYRSWNWKMKNARN